MRREILSEISRRSFLAGSAASVAASPALAQRGRPPSTEVDCVIVGAGAAGIAAARRLRETGRSFILIEASNRIGGRCFAETASFGVPFDRGAHLDLQPGLQSADASLRRAPGSRSIRRRRRSASASAGATPARASLRTISPPRCAPAAPCRTPCAARRDIERRQRGAEGPRRVAVHRRVCARPLFRGQGPRRGLGDRSQPRRRPRHRRDLPPGLRRAAGQARRGHSGAARHRGQARRCHRPRQQGRAVDHQGRDRRPLLHHHGVDQCGAGPHQVRRRPAEAPSGGVREAEARQLRSHRAGAAPAIRSGCRATIWCSRSRPARAPRRCSPMSAARRCRWSRSAASSAAISARRATRRWSSSRWNG